MNEDATKKLTFFSKNSMECPVCQAVFYKEELLTGGGRMIAGALGDDLRRRYEPSRKFGDIYPLIYYIVVCPSCYYAAWPQDFLLLPETLRSDVKRDRERRVGSAALVFEGVDFAQPRGLREGAASYYLAGLCYDFFDKEFSPTIKQAICMLRAAWTCEDLHRSRPSENYDYLALNFFRKARFFYAEAAEREQSGEEGLGAANYLGPDLDKNYSYDGALYMAGLLELKYGPRENSERRIEALTRSKRTIAKIFGLGRASKAKPSPLLDKARDLFTRINQELEASGVEPDESMETDAG